MPEVDPAEGVFAVFILDLSGWCYGLVLGPSKGAIFAMEFQVLSRSVPTREKEGRLRQRDDPITECCSRNGIEWHIVDSDGSFFRSKEPLHEEQEG